MQSGPIERFRATSGVVAGQEIVVHPAIAVEVLHGDPTEQAVAEQGAGQHSARPPGIEATGFQLDCGLGRGGRCVGFHDDQSGMGVGAVSRALGAPEHLDLAHVEQACGGGGAGEIDVVDDHADRRVQGFGELSALTDAANLEEARAGCAAGQVDVGCQRQHVLQVLTALAQHPVLDDGHAVRKRHQFGVPVVTDHDDFRYRRGGGLAGRGRQQAAQQRCGELGDAVHLEPPVPCRTWKTR